MDESQEIRLRYSAIVNYAGILYRMLIAVGFVVIVARKLSITEFGLWGVLLSLSYMVSTPVGLWGSWAQRFHARGFKEASGTGLWLTLIYWFPGSAFFLALVSLEYHVIGWGLTLMLLALPFSLLTTLDQYLMRLANVSKPELRGYKSFIYETSRIILAYILVAMLKLGLEGAIISVEIALALGVFYTTLILWRKKVLNRFFSKELATQWLKAIYIPSISIIYGFLRGGVRAIISWIAGSEIPVSYLNIGFSVETPLLQASAATTPALYARTLRRGRSIDIEETFRIYFLFIGYVFVTFTLLSKAIASLYNPVYTEAYIVIILVSLYAVINSVLSIYGATISGMESVDIKGIKSHRAILKSYLLKLPLSRLISLLASYAIAILLLFMVKGDHLLEAEATVVALILGISPLLPYFRRTALNMLPHTIPRRELYSTFASSLAAAFYYLLSGAPWIRISHFWTDAPTLGLHIVNASLVYIIVNYISSPWFRMILRRAFTLVKEMIHGNSKNS